MEHIWDICDLHGDVVRCGNCGNLTCNPFNGTPETSFQCDDCDSATELYKKTSEKMIYEYKTVIGDYWNYKEAHEEKYLIKPPGNWKIWQYAKNYFFWVRIINREELGLKNEAG